jgi:hypothetical protein
MQEIIESFLDILQDSIGGDGNEIGMSGSCVPQKQKWRWNFTFVGVCSFYCFSNRHNIIMSVECGLCGTSARECMRVPHIDSAGHSLKEHVYCSDCWVKWKNNRENLDGQNEHGVRCMTCPHCQKPLGDDEAIYMKVQPTIYDILVESRTFHVTSDTTVANFKRTILWSTIDTVYTETCQFDLVVENMILDGHYLGVLEGTVIHIEPRRTQLIKLFVFPCLEIFTKIVFTTTTFEDVKAFIGHEDSILCDSVSFEEFDDNRTVGSYDFNLITIMSPTLYNLRYS